MSAWEADCSQHPQPSSVCPALPRLTTRAHCQFHPAGDGQRLSESSSPAAFAAFAWLTKAKLLRPSFRALRPVAVARLCCFGARECRSRSAPKRTAWSRTWGSKIPHQKPQRPSRCRQRQAETLCHRSRDWRVAGVDDDCPRPHLLHRSHHEPQSHTLERYLSRLRAPAQIARGPRRLDSIFSGIIWESSELHQGFNKPS